MICRKWILVLIAVAFAAHCTALRAQQPTEFYVNLTQSPEHADQDTGVKVAKGDKINISATGIMNWYPDACNNNCLSTPNGSSCPYTGFYAQGLPCWSLIGQIGDGKPFFVGSSLQNFVAPASGDLYLGVNDNNYGDNIGAWFVTIDQNGKLQGDCPCNRSSQGVFPSSGGDPANMGSGTDGGSTSSGYPSSAGGGAWGGGKSGGFARAQTNSNAGGVGPRALTGDYSVDLATGNLFYEDTDYTTAGQNPLSFTRFYNSRANVSGAPTLAGEMGANWRTTYDRYLQISTSQIIAEREDGQQLTFTHASGVWTPDSDIDLTLTQSGDTWTLTDHGDTQETYTAVTTMKAVLSAVKARNGYTQTLDYNSDHQLTSVKDSYSRTLSFTYDSTGSLETVSTPDDTVIRYGYVKEPATGNYNLTSVTYPTEPAATIQYSYPNGAQPQQLWGVIDENGQNYITWNYSLYSKIAESYIGGGGYNTTYTYNANGTTTVTGPFGVADTYTFTVLQGIPKITKISRAKTSSTPAATETFAYDSNGYLASATDWNGNKTTYTNNSHGDPMAINEAVGASAARTTTIKYDPTWIHQPDTVTTSGLTTSYTYDANGNALTRSLKDTTTASGTTRTWTNTWSDYLLASTKSPNGNTTKFGYDSAGALTSITDPLKHITSITENTGGGRPRTIVDPNKATTTLTYDARQRLTSSTISGSGGSFATEYAINPIGTIAKMTLPDKSFATYTYRPSHILSEMQDALGNNVINMWDGLDDLTQVSLTNSSGTVEHSHTATFDALGRKLTDVGGAGQTTTFTYDKNGNVLTVKDGDGHVTTNVYDALNRLIKSTDANGGLTTITYDAHNLPLTVTDPDGNASGGTGHVTKYVYDGFGELISQTSPDSGVSVFHYDADGNLIQKTDALGIVANHTYDKLGRILTTTYPADAPENVTYTYDQTGTGFSFGIGRLTSVTDQAGSLTRAYDERGNLLSETRVNGKTTLKTAYTYDPASRIASITYPDGTLVTNTYNAAGYLSQVSAKPSGSTTTTTLATIGHLPFGPMNSVTYGNGIAETRSYDLDYRPTGILDTLGDTNLQSLGYAYDGANNLDTLTDSVNTANSQKFTYDVINRLISAASGSGGYGSQAWTYDKVGNRLTQKLGTATTTLAYTPGTNRLASIGSVKVTTNANGNITSIPPANSSALATFVYNKANRLSSVTGSPVGATFLYDWQGQRFGKTDAGSKPILFSYMQGGTLIAENDNGSVNDYVYADGRPIADLQPGAKIIADQINYILADHLGTPQLAVNSSGATVWQTTYQPFGTTGNVAASITQNLRFPGQYADTETGFSYNLNRDYMPNIGRYIETDPIGLDGGLNSYTYADLTPEELADATGTDVKVYSVFGFHYFVGIDTPGGTRYFEFSETENYYAPLTVIAPVPGTIGEENLSLDYGVVHVPWLDVPLSDQSGNVLSQYLQNQEGVIIPYQLETIGGTNCLNFAVDYVRGLAKQLRQQELRHNNASTGGR